MNDYVRIDNIMEYVTEHKLLVFADIEWWIKDANVDEIADVLFSCANRLEEVDRLKKLE